MGYVAAKGGCDAIRAAEELVERHRRESLSSWLELDQIIQRLGYAVDRVMGEGGLWDEPSGARALRQAEGDIIEAAHILRAHRATLPRLGYANVVSADAIECLRRIVPAFREPPGPQLLGRTLDYTGRLLDEHDEDEARRQAADAAAARQRRDAESLAGTAPDPVAVVSPAVGTQDPAGTELGVNTDDAAAAVHVPGRLPMCCETPTSRLTAGAAMIPNPPISPECQPGPVLVAPPCCPRWLGPKPEP